MKPGRDTARRRLSAWACRLAVLLAAAGSGAAALDVAFPPPLDRLTPSTRVFADDGTLLHAFLTRPGTGALADPAAWRLATRPEAVDHLYLDMLLAIEDRRFQHHPGVDPLAAARAFGQLIRHGRVVSGASTLPMQAARLLEPRRERSLKAKAKESLRAIQLSWRLGKTETLSAYLTLAPFGGNLEGVRAGSLAWFGKEPLFLTPGEAALLVALPRSPERLRPDRFPAAARAARDAVLDRAAAAGVLPAARAAEAKREPIPSRQHALPRLAPHLSARLAGDGAPGRDIHTTLNAELQARLEDLARQTAAGLGPYQSVALLAVESRSGRILASVGAPHRNDGARAGYIDMTRAVRSPGSALKPLIYGLAFEDRLLHPQTVLMDRPTRFGAYTPSNFDDAHWGEVTAEEALIQSLNVPAVLILDRIGPIALTARLTSAGIPVRLPPGMRRPGLPLALGGLGLTLEDLVWIYAAIDAGGQTPPLTALAATATAPRRLLGPTAAAQVAAILEKAPPPAGYGRFAAAGKRTVGYKTGTSYGYRDAYAIGSDGRTTIGVWVGRPDGSSSPGDFGRKTAAPVLFQAFERLEPVAPPRRAPPTDPLGRIDRTADLPPGLQRFATTPTGAAARLHPLRDVAAALGSADGPEVVFPPDGAIVDWTSGNGPLALNARGGTRPLVWLVNGAIVPSAAHTRETRWQPEGAGLTRISVIDAAGRAARATVYLRPSP